MIGSIPGAAKMVLGFANSIVKSANSASRLGSSLSSSFSKIKPGAVGRDLGRLRMKAYLKMDPAGLFIAIKRVGEDAMEMLANDTREKIVNSFMGNRKDPYNVFPKNRVNQRTGQYYKNSIARPWPKAPRPYTKPGDPIALQQVVYRKQKDTRSSIVIDGTKIDVSEYITGPIAQGMAATTRGTPGKLEKGGTTRAYYRFVPTPKGTYRQEFSAKRKPTKLKPAQSTNKRPARYASWRQVNDVMRSRGQKVGGYKAAGAMTAAIDPDWQGPKTFTIRGRHHASKAWDRVKPRASRMMNIAKSKLPRFMAQNIRLKNQKLKAVQGAKP